MDDKEIIGEFEAIADSFMRNWKETSVPVFEEDKTERERVGERALMKFEQLSKKIIESEFEKVVETGSILKKTVFTTTDRRDFEDETKAKNHQIRIDLRAKLEKMILRFYLEDPEEEDPNEEEIKGFVDMLVQSRDGLYIIFRDYNDAKTLND